MARLKMRRAFFMNSLPLSLNGLLTKTPYLPGRNHPGAFLALFYGLFAKSV
jgi:hypothetical protein